MNFIGLDIETSKSPNSLPWCAGYYLSCISISRPDGTKKSWVFHHDEKALDPLLEKVYWAEIQQEINNHDGMAAYNTKFELNNLRKHLTFKKLWDGMVGEYIIRDHEKALSLDACATRYGLPIKDDRVKKMWDSGMDTREIPLSILLPYCEHDAEVARKLYELQHPIIQKQGKSKVMELQMEWMDMLSYMETKGILWDQDRAQSIVDRFSKFKNVIESKLYKYIKNYIPPDVDINLGSNDDLSIILYGGVFTRKVKGPVIKYKNIKTRIPTVFTYKDGRKVIKPRWIQHLNTPYINYQIKDKEYATKGLRLIPAKKSETSKSTADKPFYKVDKDTLPFLNLKTHDQKCVVKLLGKLNKIDKVITTFISKYKGNGQAKGLMSKVQTDGKIHTNYNQAVVATGRLSSSDPNSQNLPRDGTSPIKQCIIPTLDYIMDGDISQIELRVPAQLAQDKVMMKEFINGEDLHANAVINTFKVPLTKDMRYHAKRFNFRMIYGGTEYGFYKDPTMPNFTLPRWGQIVKKYYERYKGLKNWQENNIQHVIDGDGTLTLPTGRRYKFKLGPNFKYNEREIKNYPVQGMAGGDILPLCGVILWKEMRKRKLKSFPILTVHDSLVFDVDKNEVDELADLIMRVFNNMPKYIKLYFGIKWIVPITGEVELGRNYGETRQIRP
jgi:DNA polymerase I-like protein with 3'-5' exonuclease and polymerase domains